VLDPTHIGAALRMGGLIDFPRAPLKLLETLQSYVIVEVSTDTNSPT